MHYLRNKVLDIQGRRYLWLHFKRTCMFTTEAHTYKYKPWRASSTLVRFPNPLAHFQEQVSQRTWLALVMKNTLEEKDKDKNNDRVFQVFFFWQTHWNFPLAENLGISRGLLSLTTTCWNFSQNVFTENFGISKGLLSFITTYHCIIVWIYES